MVSSLCVLLALGLDKLFGEPTRFHPLVGFGNMAIRIEHHFYSDSRAAGFIALCMLLMPIMGVAIALQTLAGIWVLSVLLLYLAVGWCSLEQHAERVRQALLRDDLELARYHVSHLVSRDIKELDAEGVVTATVESVLENGNDAIFAAIFWFMIAGIPGIVMYRLVNTLDAMWGYRNVRYENFGWAAARLDDFLNYIPARLTAFSYALSGQFTNAMACWRKQGRLWKSPNAGPVMAAGAGSLGLVLGGAQIYHGHWQQRITLGKGQVPDVKAIASAQRLIRKTLLIWLVILIIGGFFV